MEDPILRSLSVFWGEVLVGRYEKFASGSEQFVYDESYCVRQNPVPISRSLPVRAEAFSGPELRPFFSGLLPEESQRQRIASYLGIAETNDFAMLEALGGECAGALSILPQGSLPQVPSQVFDPLTEAQLTDIVASLPLRPMLVGEGGLRLSLAGAQSKLPVVVRDGVIGLPVGNMPSTHILKPELLDWFRGIAANEHCCMTLARSLGLPVPRTELRRIGKYDCLMVERYDRTVNAETGQVERVHQEDICQALGRTPEQKYQVEGGPLARDVVRLLRSGWSTAPARDVLAFVDQLMFNVIIGNADAHGKNYSLLYQGATRRLAPAYDLVATVFWPALAKSPAMKIGGSDSMDAICYGHWRKMSAELNLGLAQMLRRLRDLCDGVCRSTLESLSLPEACAPILDLVRRRAEKIAATTNTNLLSNEPL